MEQAELIAKVNSFDHWHYQFDLNGYKTPVSHEGVIRRHTYRKRYFFDPVVELCGGTLSGKRILDLGCNAGFWSLQAIEAGCSYVWGVDAREMNIDQANLVFDVKGIEKQQYRFTCQNVFDFLAEEIGHFDIVLCLGLFYLTNRHMSLLEMIANINTDLLIIDTEISTLDGSVLEVIKENTLYPAGTYKHEVVMFPTPTALYYMVEEFGYEVATLQPPMVDDAGIDDYQSDQRRAFICTKKSSLSDLSVPVEPFDYSETMNTIKSYQISGSPRL